MDQLDWNHVRAFLETAEAGSLSAAARKLRLTQPTLSRQVAAAEASLGVMLFERVGKSMVLTAPGLALLERAREMGFAADELKMAASGQSQAVQGRVCVSATDVVANWLLPPVVAQLRASAPGVVIDILASDAVSDLRRREADIAIRHVNPSEPDLIAKKIRHAKAYMYASTDWVARHGHPRRLDEATIHDFVGCDRAGQYLGMLTAHGFPIKASNFVCYAVNTVTHLALVRQGLGIGTMMEEVAEQLPDLVRVFDDVPAIEFPIWLVTHKELRTSRRIRVVFDALAKALA